jgi:phosphoglycolate phosphatase
VEDYYKKLGFDFEREPFTITGSEFIENYNSRFHEPDLQEGVIDVLENVHAWELHNQSYQQVNRNM